MRAKPEAGAPTASHRCGCQASPLNAWPALPQVPAPKETCVFQTQVFFLRSSPPLVAYRTGQTISRAGTETSTIKIDNGSPSLG